MNAIDPAVVGELLSVRWSDAVDILAVAAILWSGIHWVRRTRARVTFLGFAIFGLFYLTAWLLAFQLTLWILQGFLAVLVIVLVVVFQDDLRRLFELLGVWGLRRRSPVPPRDAVDALVRSIARLARSRTGALLVIPGRGPVEPHVEGGIALDGRLSEPLLLSLFDRNSPGHDGAAIVSGDRVTRFAVHLPLSTDRAQLGPGGTRHAAALGLAERGDALCVVVSEERGTVSVALDGRLRRLSDPLELTGVIRDFAARAVPVASSPAPGWRLLLRSWREALLALGLALLLWLLLVPGSQVVDVVYTAPVVVENLPKGYELEGVQPEGVALALTGSRRDLYFGVRDRLRVRIDAWYVQMGRRTFQLSPGDVEVPPGLTVRELDPEKVVLSVRRLEGNGPDEARSERPG